MAQTGYTPIQLYYSTTASAAPTSGNLAAGELAINTLDEKLYFKNSAGTVKLLASSAATNLSAPPPIGNTTPSTGAFTTLSAANGISNTGGQITQNATLASGTNSLQVTGAAGAARDIALFGQTGYSNGFTVKYTGTNMSYVFNDGGAAIATIGSTGLAVTGALSAAKVASDTAVTHLLFSDVAGTNAGNWQITSAGKSALWTATSGGSGWGKRLEVGDTGLAVTGALSATTTLQLGANPASVSVAVLGIPNQKRVYGRNAANTGDINMFYVNGSDGLVFGPGDAATIDTSGNLLVGTTSAGSYNPAIVIQPVGSMTIGNNAQATGWVFSSFARSGVGIGSITQSGTTAVLYNTTSDYRLKTVIGPVTGSGARLDALNPVKYAWNADGSVTNGFLAHEFQQVYAGSVNGTKDEADAEGNPKYQSMQAGSAEVIADLVAEIKSLRARLAAAGIA